VSILWRESNPAEARNDEKSNGPGPTEIRAIGFLEVAERGEK